MPSPLVDFVCRVLVDAQVVDDVLPDVVALVGVELSEDIEDLSVTLEPPPDREAVPGLLVGVLDGEAVPGQRSGRGGERVAVDGLAVELDGEALEAAVVVGGDDRVAVADGDVEADAVLVLDAVPDVWGVAHAGGSCR